LGKGKTNLLESGGVIVRKKKSFVDLTRGGKKSTFQSLNLRLRGSGGGARQFGKWAQENPYMLTFRREVRIRTPPLVMKKRV